MDYPTIPTLTKVFTAIFCYCLYTWTVHIIIGLFSLYICCWFRVIGFLSFWGAWEIFCYYSDAEGPGECGSGVFPAEGDGVGDKGSGNNISVDVETPLVAFLEDFHIWGLFLSCRIIGIFGGSAFRLREFYCKWRL